MIAQPRRVSQLAAVLCVFAVSPRSHADSPGGGNLLGHRGVLRANAAVPQPAGWFGLTTDFQYFKASGFLAPNQDHSRMVNSYGIAWAPWRFLEGAFALHVTSDNNTAGSSEELQVAVGDPELSLKGGAELGYGFSLGGLLDLRFPSGAGFFQSSASATNVFVAVLGSWSGGSKLPLGVHLNLGFLRDGSGDLFPDPKKLIASQRYAAQVSSFNRLVTRLAIEYVSTYVGPFVELSLEPYLGDGAPGFGDSPGLVSFGARVWPTRTRGLQILAALDVGVTGVGNGQPVVTDPNKFAFSVPRWNILFQLSYRFDPFAEPTVRGEGTGASTAPPPVNVPRTGIITGEVLDAKTDKPIWNARVGVEGEQASSLAVNPGDGSFRTWRVATGKRTVVASAEGYSEARAIVDVPPDGQGEAKLKLAPRTTLVPGTLRGTIKSVAGKDVSGVTVLIPEIDRTVPVDADGGFNVSLKPGEYKVVVSAKGLRTQTKSVRILEGSTVILNVELYK
jgi:hypothetical protein